MYVISPCSGLYDTCTSTNSCMCWMSVDGPIKSEAAECCLLSCSIQHPLSPSSILPDPILSEQASSLDPQHMTDRSCICVYSPDVQYGSRWDTKHVYFRCIVNLPCFFLRTNSIIMVDHDGNCEFFERTMREPIDADHPVWDTSSFKFKLEDSNCNQRL